jgi:transketolase
MAETQKQMISDLETKAQLIRGDIIRMLAEAGSGHPGGSLSSVEIVTALYFNVLRIKPEEPGWPDRDRFILSKGHAAPPGTHHHLIIHKRGNPADRACPPEQSPTP